MYCNNHVRDDNRFLCTCIPSGSVSHIKDKDIDSHIAVRGILYCRLKIRLTWATMSNWKNSAASQGQIKSYNYIMFRFFKDYYIFCRKINFCQWTRCVLLLAPYLHIVIINLQQNLHYVVNFPALRTNNTSWFSLILWWIWTTLRP